MFNATKHGVPILNALFNTSKKTSNNTITFGTTPYLALFTKMPAKDGTGYTEPSIPEYKRILLTNPGPYQKQIMATAVVEDGTGEYSGRSLAVVRNQDLATFQEAESTAMGTIVGYGVFESATATTASFWKELGQYNESGDFVTETVEIGKGQIPIFRIGDLEIKFA